MDRDSKEAKDLKTAFEKVRLSGSGTLLLMRNLPKKGLSLTEEHQMKDLANQLAAVGANIEAFINKVTNGR